MIEIRNKTKGPVQLIVRALSENREHVKEFTTLNIPGHKTVLLSDERVVKEYLDRNQRWGLLSAKYVAPDNTVQIEEK